MRNEISRRQLLRGTLAAMAFTQARFPLFGAPEEGELVPFLDAQPVNPQRAMVQWDELHSWITPKEQFFTVGHYGIPKVQTEGWTLAVSGLVENPKSFSLEALKARPRREYVATLECSGNGSSAGFLGGIGNARWAGTPLAPVLRECGVKPEGIEAVFFAVDQGTEKIRGKDYPQNFARSLGMQDAMRDDILLAYEMNGEPLPDGHGAPVRLVVPGWYGIAWVKWLNRIEIHDRRYMGRFMGRDYVTIRGEQRDGQVIWRETAVGKMNLKSIVARVVRLKDGTLLVSGAAWNDGTPLKTVELKIDTGPWVPAQLGEGRDVRHAWTFWSYEWKGPEAGEHTLVSRAIDARGKVQPAPDDAFITMKKTYWEANQQYPRKIKI